MTETESKIETIVKPAPAKPILKPRQELVEELAEHGAIVMMSYG